MTCLIVFTRFDLPKHHCLSYSNSMKIWEWSQETTPHFHDVAPAAPLLNVLEITTAIIVSLSPPFLAESSGRLVVTIGASRIICITIIKNLGVIPPGRHRPETNM